MGLEVLGLLAVLCFTYTLINRWGVIHFGGFDYSALVDIAYRLHQGQVIYRDFQTTTPPWFNLGAYYCFKIWGVNAAALVKGFAWITLLSGGWLYFLFRLRWGMGRSLLVLACVLSASGIFVSYWWYNPLNVYAVLLLLFSALALAGENSQSRTSKLLWVSFLFASIFAIGIKPNFAAISLILSFGFLCVLFAKQKRFKEIFALLSAAALAILLGFAIIELHELSLKEMIRSLLAVRGRAFPTFERFEQDSIESLTLFWKLIVFVSIFIVTQFFRTLSAHQLGPSQRFVFPMINWLAALIAFRQNVPLAFFLSLGAVSTNWNIWPLIGKSQTKFPRQIFWLTLIFVSFSPTLNEWIRPWAFLGFPIWILSMGWINRKQFEDKPELLTSLGLIIIGLVALYSNGEPKLTDLPFVIAGIALLPSHRFLVFALCCVCTIAGLTMGQSRYRTKIIGWPNTEEPLEHVPLSKAQVPYFEDAQGSPTLLKALQEIKVIRTDSNNRLWFGNRLQMMYASFDLPSPTGFPVWYHPGVSMKEGDEIEYLEKLKTLNPTHLIFPKNDFAFLPKNIEIWMNTNYIRQPEGQSNEQQVLEVFIINR